MNGAFCAELVFDVIDSLMNDFAIRLLAYSYSTLTIPDAIIREPENLH